MFNQAGQGLSSVFTFVTRRELSCHSGSTACLSIVCGNFCNQQADKAVYRIYLIVQLPVVNLLFNETPSFSHPLLCVFYQSNAFGNDSLPRCNLPAGGERERDRHH